MRKIVIWLILIITLSLVGCNFWDDSLIEQVKKEVEADKQEEETE